MNHRWQSEGSDGPKGGWGLLSFSLFFSLFLSFSLFFSLFLSFSLFLFFSLSLFFSFSFFLFLFLSLSLPFSLFLSLSLSFSLFLSLSLSFSLFLSLSLSFSFSLSFSLFLSLCLSFSPFLSFSFSFSFSFSLSLSLSLSFSLSLFFSLFLFLSLSLYLSLSLSRSLFFSLFLWLSTYLPTYLSMHLSIYRSIYVSIFPSICLSICLSIYPSIHPSIYLSLSLSVSVCLFICLSASFKTKLFCETFSIFELDNIENAAIQRRFRNFCTWQRQKQSNSARIPIFVTLTTSKNEAILRGFLQKWKVECRADSLVPTRFAIFRLHLSKLLRLPRKSDTGPYEVLHLSRKIISANLNVMLQNATRIRKSAPGPPNSSDEHVCCTAPAMENASLQILFKCPTPATVFGKPQKPSQFARLWPDAQSRALATRNDIWMYILTWKCASRHNGVQFSSLIWPAGSAPAALASLLFDPPEPQIIGKNSRLSYLFPHLDLLSSQAFSFLIFFLILFSSLTLPTSAFHLFILSEVLLRNFLWFYVYMYWCIYDNICIYDYICIYVYMIIYVYMHVCACIYIYMCIYVYVYICIVEYMYLCIYFQAYSWWLQPNFLGFISATSKIWPELCLPHTKLPFIDLGAWCLSWMLAAGIQTIMLLRHVQYPCLR